MEKLTLMVPTKEFNNEIISFREEFLRFGSSMDGCSSLKRMNNPNDWLKHIEDLSKIETVPENLVLSTQFIYVRESDSRIIGMIDIRHYFNDFLEKYAGNIGYAVRPTERRKGYAKKMLHDCLPYCRKIGLSRILISCADTNEASRKTILSNGGKYESTVFEPKSSVYLERYWIDLN